MTMGDFLISVIRFYMSSFLILVLISFSRVHSFASKSFLVRDKWFTQCVIFPQGVCILADMIHLAKGGELIVKFSLTCSWPPVM